MTDTDQPKSPPRIGDPCGASLTELVDCEGGHVVAVHPMCDVRGSRCDPDDICYRKLGHEPPHLFVRENILAEKLRNNLVELFPNRLEELYAMTWHSTLEAERIYQEWTGRRPLLVIRGDKS